MRSTLDPKLDVVFKLLFSRPGAKPLLISLLTAILRPPSPIEDVEVLNPELTKEEVNERGVILDLRVRLRWGTQVDVEMQAQWLDALAKRALYHWARSYGPGLERGGKYRELPRCVCVFILAHAQLPTLRFHSIFRVLEIEEHVLLSDQLELHMVELPKVPRKGTPEREAERALADWCEFFRSKTDEELEEAAMNDPVVRQAKEQLEEISKDPAARRAAYDRETNLTLYHLELSAAHERGASEGREQGREQVLREVLLRTLHARCGGVAPHIRDQVARASGDELEAWTFRIIEGATIEELFGPH